MTEPPSLADLLTEIRTAVRLKRRQTDDDDQSVVVVPPSSSPILALYFSSAWCDDSQASHGPVADAFRLTQEQQQRPSVELVYVSSDTSDDEMMGNLEPGWSYIPFDREGLRSDVKRRFGICAKKEMEALGITAERRRGGIPTLVLVDVVGPTVLLDDAIPNVMGDAKLDDPLSHWTSLLSGDVAAAAAVTAGTTAAEEEEGEELSPEDEKDAKKRKVALDEKDG